MRLNRLSKLAAVSMAFIMGISGFFSGNMVNAAELEAGSIVQSEEVQEKDPCK